MIRPRRLEPLLMGLLLAGALVWPAGAATAELSGLRFRTIGPANMSGRIVDVAVVESDTKVIYAATSTGGMWRSTDSGITWAPVFEDQPVHSIGAIAIFQPKPEILWVGTGERASRQSVSWGDGIYKSTDAGKTWKNMGLRDSRHIGRVALHPANPDIAFVAAMGALWAPNRERGLFKTVDGGATWRNVLFVDEDTGVVDVAIDPSDPSVVYAASHQRRRAAYGYHGGGPGAGLWKSTDGGETFNRLGAPQGLPAGEYGRIGISIYRKDPRIVYVCIEQGERYNASTEYAVYKAGVYRSENKGESWTHMSTWNPRPTYASQILVDPSDDQRIYMMNEYSYSDDGGKTFKEGEQTLHGDDRMIWVNPKDSRHVIKADDGGVGISYDRGLKWLFVSNLPVSQWYRIAADMQRPFWVYGGLQDNGSWAGPSATPDSWGVLNEDWIRTGGGDGFFSVPEPDGSSVFSNSQYLGLQRVDMKSRQSKAVRPWAPPLGEAPKLGNWGAPKPKVGEFTNPANWDAPFIRSPHDANTFYAGMRRLFRTRDRGETWEDLGDLTTGIDRRSLKLMGQLPGPKTLSLDDGVPYFPTITAFAESPLQKGLLYAGTDDGNVQISTDEGKTWTNVAARIPGLPKGSWIAGLEASSSAVGTVYLVADNHRSGDNANYVYRSTDRGASWMSIASDLPNDRSARTLREDPKNPRVLYLGTEFGLFLSLDAGVSWREFKNNMPRLPVYDLLVHPRDNDLVVATHGRGVWILDNVNALQEREAIPAGARAHIFSIEEAEQVRLSNPKAHVGDMFYKGENPPNGVTIDYWLGSAPARSIALTIHDAGGAEVASVTPTTHSGVNRVVWNFRHPSLPAPTYNYMGSQRPRPIPGPLALPGTYVARLVVDGARFERSFSVIEDRRLAVSAADRAAWTRVLLRLASSYRAVTERLAAAQETLDGPGASARATPSVRGADRDRIERLIAAQSRIAGVYGSIGAATAPLTASDRAQVEALTELAASIEREPRR